MSRLRLGDALDKGIDIGAIVDPDPTRDNIDQLGASAASSDGAEVYQPDIDHAADRKRGLLLSADAAFQMLEAASAVAQARDLRSRARGDELPNTRAKRLNWPTTRPTVWRHRFGARTSAWRLRRRAQDQSRAAIWINSTNHVRCRSGFRRLSRKRLSGARAASRRLVRLSAPALAWGASRPQLGEPAPDDWGAHVPPAPPALGNATKRELAGSLDRTAKLYIGGGAETSRWQLYAIGR